MRSQFLWKLYAGYALLILFTTALVGSLIDPLIENTAFEEIDHRLESDAQLLGEITRLTLTSSESDDFQRRIADLGRKLGTRFTVIAADGEVLADSEHDPAAMDNHGDRPEVLAARAEGIGSSTRFSKTLKKRMRYLALALDVEGRDVGVVRASLPLDAVTRRLRRVRGLVLAGGMVAAFVALLLALLLAHRVTRPLLSMAKAAESIAAGRYEQQIPIPSRDELGKLAQAFNTMSSELRTSIAALTADRAQMQAILASMVEGVVAVDRDERVMHMNAVAGRLCGVEPGHVLGRPIWELTRIREVPETVAEAMALEQPVEREVLRPGLPDRYIDLRASPLRAKEGVSEGAVLVLDDVTRLRRLETARRDFVSNVSHELKTPATAIRGMVEILLDDPGLAPARRRRFLEKIRLQTERLSTLVTDLLSLSRLEFKADLLELEPLDVRDSVRDAVEALQPTSEARNVVLEVELPDVPVMVAGEDEGLQEAVSNLLTNAIKYSPRGGRVWVRVEIDDGGAVIAVEDHGIGIAARHHDRIFERFYRVDKARSRELGGTGLGLAIVKHISRSLGGTVSVESRLGEGSIFRIRLPLADVREPLGVG